MKINREKSILFMPIYIGNVRIPDRFVRSATHDFMAEDDGTATERQMQLFRQLSEGEVGLIITGHVYINPNGKASPRQAGIIEDRFIEGLRRIPEAVHAFPSKIFIQLAHAGRQTKKKYCGCTPLAPSAVYEPTLKITPKEMTQQEILGIINDFIQAGRRAKEAGFDGAQLHIAHGYLLSSFISPYTNRRADEWGGSTTNRLRIVVEIVRGIKGMLGKEFPLIAKLNSTDFLPTGLQLGESIEMAKILEDEGIDGIEVSGGMSEAGKGSIWQGLRSEEEEGYFIDSASKFKQALHVPIFGLGGNRTFAVMERIVRDGKADLVSLSRPFIREPYLVKKFRTGQIDKSECISCNKCLNPRGIACAELRKKNARPDSR
jgi:2,4-dienoyl-CoA reductase-like NADH-dependent reductase (Old Yellow Enzyme family)